MIRGATMTLRLQFILLHETPHRHPPAGVKGHLHLSCTTPIPWDSTPHLTNLSILWALMDFPHSPQLWAWQRLSCLDLRMYLVVELCLDIHLLSLITPGAHTNLPLRFASTVGRKVTMARLVLQRQWILITLTVSYPSPNPKLCSYTCSTSCLSPLPTPTLPSLLLLSTSLRLPFHPLSVSLPTHPTFPSLSSSVSQAVRETAGCTGSITKSPQMNMTRTHTHTTHTSVHPPSLPSHHTLLLSSCSHVLWFVYIPCLYYGVT